VAPASLQLRTPADPPLAVTTRSFVASASRYLGLDPALCEDLRLAASELFAAAAEAEAPLLEIRMEGGPEHATLTVIGVPDMAESGDLPLSRRVLLSALFPDLQLADGTAVIHATSVGA
jgi:hypothetical protein